MGRILILGASILQVPAILEAKKMNLFVIVADSNSDAPGAQLADKYYKISTLNEEELLELAKYENVNGVLTVASDRPVPIISRITTALNLPGLDYNTSIYATNKWKMREKLLEENIPIPFFKVLRMSSEENIKAIKNSEKDFIIKPSDNSGSRGISLVNSELPEILIKKIIENALENSSNGIALLEEFMTGPEVSVESVSVNGECTIIAITDKVTTGQPHFVEIQHSQPSMLRDDIQMKIIELTKSATKAIGLINGVAHTEIIVTPDGPKIVEIGARLGGDNITSHLIPLSTGVNMVRIAIKLALGMEFKVNKKKNEFCQIVYFESRKGKVKSINGLEEARKITGVHEVYIGVNVGDIVHEMSNSNDRIGYIIAKGSNKGQVENVIKDVANLIKIVIE